MIKDITFQQIENSVVIISKNLVQSQHEAYLRKGEVFVKIGSGYIGLRRRGTSKPGVSLLDYDLGSEHEYSYTALGRIVLRDHPDAEEDAPATRVDGALPEPESEPVKPRRKKA